MEALAPYHAAAAEAAPDLMAALADWLALEGYAVREPECPATHLRVLAATWQCPQGYCYFFEYTWGPLSPAHASCALWVSYPEGGTTMLLSPIRVRELAQVQFLLGNVLRLANARAAAGLS